MVAPLIDEAGLLARLLAADPAARQIIGIAGPPGSGKSTVAERLVAAANSARPGFAALLPMDGFHYDDRLLNELGRHARKGAPDTFDVGGLAHTLARLRARNEAAVAVPVFDRNIEIARAGARLIAQSVRLVVVEGNYLLLAEGDWAALRDLFELTVMIETSEADLNARLTRRWKNLGLAPEAIAAKVEGNDLPNGRRVIAQSARADFRLRT
ncbi:nucleoside/nucleotide kinase family protein [Phaeovulum sp.]|uniref:nucleoside/nucleotide kinase family protein n=1 Tax=Phaeovulum sp. TaxID=2934796 RepID=UPI0027317396|nr:nucleoside/nucleotide kinase family protein [Phaeovulum sp.]MDP1668011.1 nucleoside/nucleotide kinase family protein [Phaeovulum sp.]MDZ4119460.1 nucleoside/nucleotide kinase family protein [Phaeovulum sp.]